MKHLAQKIGQLKKADYDRKVLNGKEVAEKLNTETSRNLELCEEFGIDASIVVSELIHIKEELTALKGKTMSFRESGSNDEKIAELSELIGELETVMREKFAHATRLKAHKTKEAQHAKALETLEPLALELTSLEKKIKDSLPSIRTLEGNRNILPNPINPDIFRLLNSIAGGF